jgi:hypothetical protein
LLELDWAMALKIRAKIEVQSMVQKVQRWGGI